MSHLTAEEIIDLIEGRPGDSSDLAVLALHVDTCEECRQQLDDAREMMAVVSAVDAVEPSPLFWDHLSARVREAVREERTGGRQRTGFAAWWAPWRLAAGTAAAVCVLAAAVTVRMIPGSKETPVSMPTPAMSASIAAGSDQSADQPDASLALLGDLAGGLGWEATANAGFMTGAGTVDGAMADLSSDERTELQRLLQEALSREQGRKVKG